MEYTVNTACLAGVFVVSMSAALLPAPTPATAGQTCKQEIHERYSGQDDDLLTAGLGGKGLALEQPSGLRIADPLAPTARELRRLAIYNNYRGLVDTSPEGGYGLLYGPHRPVDGEAGASDGRIAGDEYIKYEDDDCEKTTTMMVQIPDGYNPANGCIVAAASPGSRGVYGAVAVGEWGLKHHCAMAYTDKGTGTGADDLQAGTTNLIDGRRAGTCSGCSNFSASLSPAERADFNAKWPNRFALKHAHSQKSPEKDWGENVLKAIEFAFLKLNEKFCLGQKAECRITKENTIVIAASMSNGGGAVLRAAEQDEKRLIDGVVAGEPNVTPRVEPHSFSIIQGTQTVRVERSTPLLDYATLINVYQGCANLASGDNRAPLSQADRAVSEMHCISLHNRGLLAAASPTEWPNEAQKIINDYGILREQNLVQPGYWRGSIPQALSVTFANAYGRFSVADNLCNFSFGAVDKEGQVVPLPADAEEKIFATSGGIPALATAEGVGLINNLATGGPKEEQRSTVDGNLDGALCLRWLASGQTAKIGSRAKCCELSDKSIRIKEGSQEILASGDLHGVPAIIVTGRNDGVIAPNFASRSYIAVNALGEQNPHLRYYEVTNAHHLDAFNGLPDSFPGYGERFVPLYRYFLQSMDLMFEHVNKKKSGHATDLPPSQVVHTIARGVGRPKITQGNVPPISEQPAENEITFKRDANTLLIPD